MSVVVTAAREYVEVWRTKSCAAFRAGFLDESGVTCSELLIWNDDGYHLSHVTHGVDFAEIRRDWEAASPFNAVLVPNDLGGKRWTYLEPEPEPAAVPEPEPARASRRVDPRYEPPREERDTPITRWLSWGPGSI